MRALLLGLALGGLLALPPAGAIAVLDAGPGTVRGPEGSVGERHLLLDLWDEGDGTRGFDLVVAPDSDAMAEAEASVRAANAPAGAWRALEGFRWTVGPEPLAREHGWDGAYELAVRAPLHAPGGRLALLLLEESPGEDALAITTDFRAVALPPTTSEPPRAAADEVAVSSTVVPPTPIPLPLTPISLAAGLAAGALLLGVLRKPPTLK